MSSATPNLFPGFEPVLNDKAYDSKLKYFTFDGWYVMNICNKHLNTGHCLNVCKKSVFFKSRIFV